MKPENLSPKTPRLPISPIQSVLWMALAVYVIFCIGMKLHAQTSDPVKKNAVAMSDNYTACQDWMYSWKQIAGPDASGMWLLEKSANGAAMYIADSEKRLIVLSYVNDDAMDDPFEEIGEGNVAGAPGFWNNITETRLPDGSILKIGTKADLASGLHYAMAWKILADGGAINIVGVEGDEIHNKKLRNATIEIAENLALTKVYAAR